MSTPKQRAFQPSDEAIVSDEKETYRPAAGKEGSPGFWDETGQLRVIADALPTLIAYVDAEQRFLFNNKGYLEWFGRYPHEIRGKHIKEILGQPLYRAIRPYVESALAGHNVRFEWVLPHRDGGDRDVAVHYIPDHSIQGQVRGFFALVNDITEAKRYQESERQRLLTLAQTAKFTAIAEITAEIAHEINQPLSAIATYSAACLVAVQSGQAPETIIEWLKQINAQAKRTGQIVTRVRSLTRLDQNEGAITDMNQLVSEIVHLLAIEAHTYKVKLEVRKSGSACDVIADKGLIEQVLLNLLRNAIEALATQDREEKRVWIGTDRQKDRINVSIRDNGPGIPPALGDRIFDAFATSRPNALGMGLAICRNIIRAYQGELRVSSSPGDGADFTFTLPAAAQQDDYGSENRTYGVCGR